MKFITVKKQHLKDIKIPNITLKVEAGWTYESRLLALLVHQMGGKVEISKEQFYDETVVPGIAIDETDDSIIVKE